MNAKSVLKEAVVTMSAPADFNQSKCLRSQLKPSSRGIDVACLKVDEPVTTGQRAAGRHVASGIDANWGRRSSPGRT
jgi:hypothetical protein